jgi:hypothetical protein
MRLVVIETKTKNYTIYEDKIALITFHPDEDVFLDAEHVEELRTADYKSLA